MFGIFLISSASSFATRRSWKASSARLHRVRARIGTSSIDFGFTTTGPAPGGIRSGCAMSFVCSLTRLFSGSSPTLNRTIAIP